MSPTSHKPRLKDVAEHAGVSVATVSAVVRGLQGGSVRVGAETRARVERSIRRLGYRPNRAAQSLRTQRSGLIGIVVPDITNPIFPQFVRSAQLAAERASAHAMIWDSCRQPGRERIAIEALLDHQVDGVVLVTEHLGVADLRPLLDANIPVAATDVTLDDPAIDLVSEDLYAGAYEATTFLLGAGHGLIGHIAGDRASAAGAERERGFRAALADADVAVPGGFVVGGSSFDRAAGHAGMLQLCAADDRPTAVLAANDVLAIGALRACHELGLDVPSEMAIVGVDNTPETEVAYPPLTTMDVHPAAVAARLTDVVISRMNGSLTGGPLREIVTPTLVRRESA